MTVREPLQRATAAIDGPESVSAGAFMAPWDIGLFLRSARSDARLLRLRHGSPSASAFDRLYAEAPNNDPWASSDPRYRYQRRKYEVLASLLPKRRFARALDIGCGIGLLTERLAYHADEVLGLDISRIAVSNAAIRTADRQNVRYAQGDLLDLDRDFDGRHDLVVVADTIYYLPTPHSDPLLKMVALRLARLLAPGGVLLIANHYFSGLDHSSRLSRRIHQALRWSPALTLLAEYRKPFYLATLLSPAGSAASA